MNVYLKPTPIRHPVLRRRMNKYAIQRLFLGVIIIAAFALLIFLPPPAEAANPLANPPRQPNGLLCQGVPGGIDHTKAFINDASGVTYQFDRPIKSALTLPTLPAYLSLYDADSATTITLTNGSNVVAVLSYATGNNKWSEPQTINQAVTSIEVQTPATHPSTNLCFTWEATYPGPIPSVTPEVQAARLTMSADILYSPTGLFGEPEPIDDASVNSDDLYIPTGETGTIYMRVLNSGDGWAKGVQVEIEGDTSVTLPAGDIAPGDVAVIVHEVNSHDGVNAYKAHLQGDSTKLTVSWRGNSNLFIPLVAR